jgi:two-component system, LytTR family, sensor kinase
MDKKTIIKIHLFFWIVSSCISYFHIFAYLGNPLIIPLIISIFIRIFCNAVTFYTFYFLVSAKYFNRKGITLLVFFELIYLSVFGIVSTFIYYLPFAYTLSQANPLEYLLKKEIRDSIFVATAYIATFSILGSLSKVSLIWYRNQLKKKEIEKQNISNELAMLKVQINPHFLFNTMNNIKSLIKSRPSEAINSIEKLNDMMQYMIFDSSFDAVPLINEIRHINNYLELEKIRFSDPDYINFKITGDYQGITIPPLIFMPFIENTFKHGNRLKPSPGIIIKINITDTIINFETSNFIKENYEMKNKKSGFGLSNIRRRLDLLFEKKYELEIKNENKIFSVNLNLILK